MGQGSHIDSVYCRQFPLMTTSRRPVMATPTVSPTHRAAESQLAFRLSSEGGIRKARVNVRRMSSVGLSNERRFHCEVSTGRESSERNEAQDGCFK